MNLYRVTFADSSTRDVAAGSASAAERLTCLSAHLDGLRGDAARPIGCDRLRVEVIDDRAPAAATGIAIAYDKTL